MSETPSILKAFALLNKTTGVEAESSTKAMLPTAKSRKALDILINSAPSDLQELNLKEFLQDLFNWDGKNHVNKPLIRAFQECLTTKNRYPQTVEFTGYMVAMAPMLEADQIARMYAVVKDTKTSFAPTLYTVNFHSNLKRAFAGLSPQRIEKLGLSLWQEAHNGRWWNMTVGVENVAAEQGAVSPEVIYTNLLKFGKNDDTDVEVIQNVVWSPENQEKFTKFMNKNLDKDIAVLAETFRKQLMSGKPATPDIAIFLSAIDWLAPNQRPESPINSLLRNLVHLREEDESFRMPKKPNTIRDMFPHLELTVDKNKVDFPLDPQIIQSVRDKSFIKSADKVELVMSKNALAQNAKHMGNCTAGQHYMSKISKGECAMLYVQIGSSEYNVALNLGKNNSWKLGEVNSRYNRGQVPIELRKSLTKSVQNLDKVSEQYLEFAKNFNKEKQATFYQYVV